MKASIEIQAEEKKLNYGQIAFNFQVKAAGNIMDPNALHFCILSKQGTGRGQYIPVYKSECKRALSDNTLVWNKVDSNTDTIGDNNELARMRIQIFKFNDEGSHKCHTETEFDFGVII